MILNDIFTLPNLLASFDYSFSDLRAVKTHVNIDFNKIKPTDGVITYEFTDGATYKEPHLNYPNGDMITVDLKNILKSKGTRMIANGIKLISNGENDCELIYPNGDKYQGTIMGKAVYLMGRDASTKTVTYKDGVFTSGNKTEKWFNGESFSKRHERLVQVMDSDLWVAEWTDYPGYGLYRKILEEFTDILVRKEMAHEPILRKNGRIRKASQGGYIGGKAPMGYKVVSGRLEVNPEEVPVVRFIMDEKHRGGTKLGTVEKLNAQGYKTRRGGAFQISTVQGIWNNEKFYKGFYRLKGTGEWVKGQHEAIL